MGKIEGISIKNFGSLKNVTLGKTFSHQMNRPLGNRTSLRVFDILLRFCEKG